jgi:hypothetical protein
MAKLFTAGRWYGNCVSKAVVAADLTSTITLFTIEGGPIKVWNAGFLVTTLIPAGANTLTFRFTPDGGSITDLSGATDTASGAKSQLYMLDGAKATGPVKTTDVGILAAGQTLVDSMPIVLSPGVVYAVMSGGPPATGAGLFFMEYSPISNLSKVSV